MSEVAEVLTLEGLREFVRARIEPLREELVRIDHLILLKQDEIVELRGLKREIERVLNAADRDRDGSSQPRQKRRVSEENVNALQSWLQTNFSTEQDLTRRLILEQWPVPMTTDSVARCIERLVDRGVLRLDRLDRSGRGSPAKIYRLT